MTGDVPDAVTFRDVSVRLGHVQVLEAVNASVPRGSATAIIGPNGAGKTTLLLALLGQIPYAGRIEIVSGNGSAARIGYVPQRLEFDRGMPLTVMEMMLMGVQGRPLWLGLSRRRKAQAAELLAAVNADHLADRALGALSGGELQRVLLALALQQDPQMLILDEPAAGVDIAGENLLCELLERLRPLRGFTQVMVTHDLSLVTAHATHVICLNRTVKGQGPVKTTLNDDVLAATFGIHLGFTNMESFRRGGYPHGDSCKDHKHG